MSATVGPWYFRDPERLVRERAALDELRTRAEWLSGVEWRIQGDLCVDAVVRAHEHDYDLRVTFPTLYPDVPAAVRPIDETLSLSSHQYGGAGGVLCLEWGPDNWHREVTAAQLLESAYRLLDIENPLGQNRPGVPEVAPSRHALSAGQAVRTEWARWYAADWLYEFMEAQPASSSGVFRLSWHTVGKNWTCLVHEAGSVGGTAGRDPQIPTRIDGAISSDLNPGAWFKTELDPAQLHVVKDRDALKALIATTEAATLLVSDGSSPIPGLGSGFCGILVADRLGELHLFLASESGTAIKFSVVRSERAANGDREVQSAPNSDVSVGIVGLGSAGSKIAISLARIGIRKFLLIDHDLFLPENIPRHALDWRSVAQHKVDAIEAALLSIDPRISIERSRLHLTGQESNAAVSGALDKLAACDVILDATANPKAFNLLSATASASQRAMVWLEIFGGGVGGLVARSRPSIDPSPQDMRQLFLQYCVDHPAPEHLRRAEDYLTESPEGEVLAASDAEVAIIAHHAVRLVVDCLSPAEASAFPYSMYLIGLRGAWVFEAPFATIPISTEGALRPEARADETTAFGIENIRFLSDVLGREAAR